MTPNEAVSCLATIVGARAEFTDDTLYDALIAAGAPHAVADRALKFTQIAWGRTLLDGIGLRFPPNYICFDCAGQVLEAGNLSDQPYFVAALDVLKKHPPANWPTFALMSSDVAAINQALKAGSKPENLALAPAAMFMEMPSPAGLKAAQSYLMKHC